MQVTVFTKARFYILRPYVTSTAVVVLESRREGTIKTPYGRRDPRRYSPILSHTHKQTHTVLCLQSPIRSPMTELTRFHVHPPLSKPPIREAQTTKPVARLPLWAGRKEYFPLLELSHHSFLGFAVHVALSALR